MVFSFVQIFFQTTRFRILFFCRAKLEFFYQNLTLGYITKTLIRLFFFSSTKIRIFFSATLGIRIFFLEKNHNPPLQVKWSFPKIETTHLNWASFITTGSIFYILTPEVYMHIVFYVLHRNF